MAETENVVVGRVGKPHGLAGDVTVEVRTDEPEVRFAKGRKVRLIDQEDFARDFTITNSKFHSGRLLVRFAHVVDREGAEAIRGRIIEVEVPSDEQPQGVEEFYDRHLVGLKVLDTSGLSMGEVIRVDHLPGQDYLIVDHPEIKEEVMVPFTSEFVPTVDLESGLVTVDGPKGLFNLDEAEGDSA